MAMRLSAVTVQQTAARKLQKQQPKNKNADLAAVGGHGILGGLLPGAVPEPLVVARGIPPMSSPEVWVLQLRLPVSAGRRSMTISKSACQRQHALAWLELTVWW
jgi:hypothetical protein